MDPELQINPSDPDKIHPTVIILESLYSHSSQTIYTHTSRQSRKHFVASIPQPRLLFHFIYPTKSLGIGPLLHPRRPRIVVTTSFELLIVRSASGMAMNG
ncbi:hypothetical protein ABVT39_004518 [Epinephelus coioides]